MPYGLAAESDGAKKRKVTQMNQEQQADMGTSHNGSTGKPNGDSSDEKSPWDKFLARLRSVRLVKSATKLRGLRDEANGWFPRIEGERQAAEAELETETDPLDKAALKEDLEAISKKVTRLNDGLDAINERAITLVGDSAA